MQQLKIGIIGSGFIAGVIAEAAKHTNAVEVMSVTSRNLDNATKFAEQYEIGTVFTNWPDMILSEDIDAIYVATPTTVREEICVAAANAGKHIFAEKPFASEASLQNIVDATLKNGVAFMDATHFSHNPRTKYIKQKSTAEIGSPKAIRSTFFYPFDDRDNIRFDPSQEPLGSIGDLGWYNMRAIVEFLDTDAEIKTIAASCDRDDETGVIQRSSGVIEFDDGKTATFDFGFNAGVILMDLDIIGDKGIMRMDDFVLDWHRGFDFSDGHYDLGVTLRADMEEPDDWRFTQLNDPKAQKIYMIENFAKMAADPSSELAIKSATTSLKTQKLVDALWQACNR